ncbi:MAG TPA: [FeFe] hydrogenase H-cluster radical SAM maturase HydE [Clostridia bacterium]|nr:[FeFe] hydrogenase H-cluster radical SAM maturase HydE [Clostridia bacterium]
MNNPIKLNTSEKASGRLTLKELPQKLLTGSRLELAAIIEHFASISPAERKPLFDAALEQRRLYYGNSVYFRGLIEFSSYCRNDCYYCGIRKSNRNAVRYRLTAEEILACCEEGRRLGFRTFVLQSGEDPYYTDDLMCRIIAGIRERFPECAITLSVGEKSRESYRKYFDAGADRYLLRHETADEEHYMRLHPEGMSLSHRKQCLYELKEIGYQIGAGFMVGSPGQTLDNLASDLIFLRGLKPHMIGIGPFIPHKDTVFADEKTPTKDLTLIMLSLLRLMLPKVLLPATTALGTVDPNGREDGLGAGANVVMPNLSPVAHRKDYSLYDNKICTGEEAAECLGCLTQRIRHAGFEPDFSRGDSLMNQA